MTRNIIDTNILKNLAIIDLPFCYFTSLLKWINHNRFRLSLCQRHTCRPDDIDLNWVLHYSKTYREAWKKKVPKRRAAKDARRRYVNAISGATSENINIQV